MELGEKIRTARLEAGLSQRQLCGEEITRNMLSQIEHGSATPSMRTLKYLAGRLGKNVSYFLEEDAPPSPNRQIMEAARQCFDAQNFAEAVRTLEDYQSPDPVSHREYQLLLNLCLLSLAEEAAAQGRTIYARELLGRMDLDRCYCADALLRRRLLLWGKLGGSNVSGILPSLDEELLLRSREAFQAGDLIRAARLLDAAQDQALPQWNLMRGLVYLAQTQYPDAARCLHAAEEAYPKETAFRLEHCYREMEDYKRAYEYACKQR